MRFRRLNTGLLVLAALLMGIGRSPGDQDVELPPPVPVQEPGKAGPTAPGKDPVLPEPVLKVQKKAEKPDRKPAPVLAETALPPTSEPVPIAGEAPKEKRELFGPTPAPALVPVTERKVEKPAVPASEEAPAFRLIKPPQPPSLGTPQGFSPPRIVPVNPSAPLALPKIPGAALVVEKITLPPGKTGQVVAYEVVIRNIGSGPAFHVWLEDPLPSGTTFQSSIPLAQNLQDHLIWVLGRIEPGAEKRCKVELLAAKPVAEWPGVLVRYATGPALFSGRSPEAPVQPAVAPALPSGKVESVAGPTVQEPAAPSAASGLELKAGCPEKADRGEKVVLQLEIHNPGNNAITDLVLHVHLADGLEHPQGHEIEANLKGVGVGETRKIELPVKAIGEGWQANQIWVTQGTQVLGRAKTRLLIGKGGGLQVKQTAPRQVWLEREMEYRVEITNSGTTPAENVRVNDILPRGLEFVAASEGGVYDPLARIIHWQLDSIRPGQVRGLTIKFRAQIAGDWTNRVMAQFPSGRPASAETVVTVNGLTALVLEVSARENQVEVGGETVYEIRVLNRGSQAATGIDLAATMPSGLKPLTAEGPVSFHIQNQKVNFNRLARLDPGAETRFKLHVRCQTPGEMRLRVQLTSEQQQVPIIQEESTQVQ